jgi:arylformamidase
MQALLDYGALRVAADLSDALSIAVPLDFDGPQPNAFDLPKATARAVRQGGFVGDTRSGGSVNCESLSLVPHGNGTHTECLGHVTDERISVAEVLHGGLWLAALVSVTPLGATATDESTAPPPRAGDRLVTAGALVAALDGLHLPDPARAALGALIVRTLPNTSDKISRTHGLEPSPAYFSAEAARFVVGAGIRHLVTDLPSLDRSNDEGFMTAHRTFWQLPPGSRDAGPDARRACTVTELAYVAPMIRDGLYVLDLQVPAFLTDAVPSRPLLYRASIR